MDFHCTPNQQRHLSTEKKGPLLFRVFLGDEIRSSYVGIIIKYHFKDPVIKQPGWLMESKARFFVAHLQSCRSFHLPNFCETGRFFLYFFQEICYKKHLELHANPLMVPKGSKFRRVCPQAHLPYEVLKNSGWWFQIFFIFTPIWGRFPFWPIFFRWVGSTTN